MKKKNLLLIVGLVLACIVILGATLAPNATKEPTATNEPTLIDKTITQNGTYNASDFDADGFSSVTVDVPAPEIAKRNFVISTDIDYIAGVQDWEQGRTYTSYYIDNTNWDEEETLKLKVETSADTYAIFDNDDSPFWVIDEDDASFKIYCDNEAADAVIVAIQITYSGGNIYYQEQKVKSGKFTLINNVAEFTIDSTVYISEFIIYGYCNQ